MNNLMTFDEFISNPKLNDEQIISIIHKTIQTLLDVNYRGTSVSSLGKSHINQMTMYVRDNYNFRFVNSGIMNSVVAEPK